MKPKKGELQVREVVFDKGVVTAYKVVRGDLWVSGYDERVGMELINTDYDGTYRVTFYPIGEELGMDSITDLKIERISNAK